MSIQQIARLAEQLSTEEQLQLVEHLARGLRQRTVTKDVRKPQDLYGVWRDNVPSDFDLDAALASIRHRNS